MFVHFISLTVRMRVMGGINGSAAQERSVPQIRTSRTMQV